MQNFLRVLSKVSQDVKLEVMKQAELNNFNFDVISHQLNEDQEVAPDINEISQFSQMFLMHKIRKHSSKEYMSIIDSIFICEIDSIQTQWFDNPQVRDD